MPVFIWRLANIEGPVLGFRSDLLVRFELSKKHLISESLALLVMPMASQARTPQASIRLVAAVHSPILINTDSKDSYRISSKALAELVKKDNSRYRNTTLALDESDPPECRAAWCCYLNFTICRLPPLKTAIRPFNEPVAPVAVHIENCFAIGAQLKLKFRVLGTLLFEHHALSLTRCENAHFERIPTALVQGLPIRHDGVPE